MTDKEIIIDGIDVSECEFYCEEYCNLSNDRNERLPFAEKCTGYSDCCYKQLKRKEQECESQKQRLEYYTTKITQLLDDINKYEQALDEIEEIINEPCANFDKTCEECDNNCEQKILDIINKAKATQNILTKDLTNKIK